jgi:uncharacterized membrane protein YagU involved in acid resistance
MATSADHRRGFPAAQLANVAGLVSACAAGFAATLTFTLFMWYGGKAIAGFNMDVSSVLAQFLGENPMLGAMGHYVTGTIAYPIAYLAVRGILPGAAPAKGAVLGVLLWLVANIVLLPLVGTGLFMTGLFGTAMGDLAPPLLTSLIGHVVFGLVLAIGTDRIQAALARS